jgi:hypothetical protein
VSARTLGRLLAFYTLLLATLCGWARWTVSLHPLSTPLFVATRWEGGAVRAHCEGASEDDVRGACAGAGALVVETATGIAPMPSFADVVLAVSVVPGRDGVRVTLDGQSATVGPDELLAAQLYDAGLRVDALGIAAGVDVPKVTALLATRLQRPASELRAHGSFQRVRFERLAAAAPLRTAGDDEVQGAARAAAAYVARSTDERGLFRYLVDAPSNRDLGGYEWTRHAGAAGFLGRAAWRPGADNATKLAALRAVGALRTVLGTCGAHACFGEGDPVHAGGAALALVAFADLASSGLDPSAREAVGELADGLRAQQRPDGEIVHWVHRDGALGGGPQMPYFTGEAALALARAHALLGRPEDLEAARRALAYVVGSWRFFGDRYWYAEEHWTCQAMAALWSRAPDAQALELCMRWMEWTGASQLHAGDAPFDVDGALGVGPFVVPRVAALASRCEAGGAILSIARAAGVDAARVRALEVRLSAAVSWLVRRQLRPASLGAPGPHLFVDAAAVDGGFPESEVRLALRIDTTQHAGDALLRWLERPR